MAQHARDVRLGHGAIGHFRFARAAGRDERAPVSARGHLARRQLQRLALVAAFGVVLAAGDLAAILEVVFVHHLLLVALVVHVADVEEHLLAVGVLGDAEHGVGRLALVLPLESPAQRHHPHRVHHILAQRPLRDVELVRALVVHVAVARLPEPVPVVVDVVGVELVDDGRPAPQVPVQVGRRIAVGLEADGVARLAAVTVGDDQLAELPGLDRLVQPGDARVAAALRAVLNDDLLSS